MRFVFETNVFAESLDIALAHGLQDEAGRAYSNLYDLHARLRLFAASESWFAEGLAYCDEHDLTSNASYLRGVRIRALERTGRWNEAVSLSRDLLASAGPSPLNRLPAVTMLGLIAARRAPRRARRLAIPGRGGRDGRADRRAAVDRASPAGPGRGVLAAGRGGAGPARGRAGR